MSVSRILAPLIVFVGCAAPDTTGTLTIGHGGLGPDGAFPMDSREAIFGALEKGLHGVELDAQLTNDSVIVAYHDLEVSGTVVCDGRINASKWAVLQQCLDQVDDRTFFRLDEALPEAIRKYPDTEFTLDVKLNANGDWWTYLRSFSAALKALHGNPELRGRLLVECRTEDFLRLLHEEIPDLPLYYYCDDAELGIETALQLGCVGITIHTDQIDREQVERAHAAGLSVTVFGVGGNMALKQALKKEPDRVQIDS